MTRYIYLYLENLDPLRLLRVGDQVLGQGLARPRRQLRQRQAPLARAQRREKRCDHGGVRVRAATRCRWAMAVGAGAYEVARGSESKGGVKSSGAKGSSQPEPHADERNDEASTLLAR